MPPDIRFSNTMSGCVKLCSVIFLSLPFAVSAFPLNDSNDSQYTAPSAINRRRTQTVTIAALVCSSLSMVASFMALCWVCRIEKQFRHRLLMLLVCGDSIRAICFFIGAIVMLARGTVRSNSPFCQSSGFFIVFGTEMSDFAVLMIAIHSALQVFRPSGQAPSEGLYPYRRYIYVGAFCAPVITASLAFLNQQGGYLLQGAFCLLPVRPFWYRLALSWIPRYIIALVIITLAIAIYTYVGWEFRSYNKLSQRLGHTMTDDIAGTNINISALQTQTSFISEGVATRPDSSMTHQKLLGQHSRGASLTSQDAFPLPGRRSPVSFVSNEPCGAPETTSTSPTTQSFSRSTRRLHSKHSGPARPPLVSIPSGHTVRRLDSEDSLRLPLSSHTDKPSAAPVLSPLSRVWSPPTVASLEPPSPGFNRMARQRARMHRQLRLMFIYPIIYTLMWLLPFVYHCMMYNDYYATHPVWAMRVANTICIATMGLVDCLVFALRERPWRAIPKSDGTFLGSFFVWNGKNERRRRRRRRSMDRMRSGGRSRSAGPCEAGVPKEEVTQRSLSDGGLYAPRRSVGSSASFYGYSRAEKNWARERLEWEREERYRMLREQAMRSETITSRRGSLSESSYCGREAEESRRDRDYDFDDDDDDDAFEEGERTEMGVFEKSHGHDAQGNDEETQRRGGNSIS